jgi:hypothetical protein
MKTCIFSIGDRVKPTSGPYRRTEFEVVGIEGDRISVQSSKLTRTFPAKLLRACPPKKHGSPTPILTYGVKAGKKPSPEGALAIAAVIKVAPEKLTVADDFKVGDRVHFEQYWNGKHSAFEGTIARLGEPEGTAIVHFQAPESGQVHELQAPIWRFSLTPVPPERSLMDEPKTAHPPSPDALEKPETIETSLPLPFIDVAQGKPLSARFKVGDRVAGIWDEEITGTVEAVHPSGRVMVKWSDRLSLEFFDTALIPVSEIKADNFAAQLPSGGSPEANTSATLSTSSILAEIAAIRAEGAIAPSQCWIERKVHASGFTEAVFKSRTAIFTGKGGGLCKSKYIGRWESPAHSAAVSAVDRRNRIEMLRKALEKIEK